MYRIKNGCPECGACVSDCPAKAIIKIPDALGMKINENCIDCGLCVNKCPVNLIEAVEVENEENEKTAPTDEKGRKFTKNTNEVKRGDE